MSTVTRVSWRSPLRHWCSTPSPSEVSERRSIRSAAGHRVGAEAPEPIDRQDVEALVAARVGRRQRQPARRLPAPHDRAGIVAGALSRRQELRLAAVVADRHRDVVGQIDADRRARRSRRARRRNRGSGCRWPAGSGRRRARARRTRRRWATRGEPGDTSSAPRPEHAARRARHSTPPPARVSSKPARSCHWTRPKTRTRVVDAAGRRRRRRSTPRGCRRATPRGRRRRGPGGRRCGGCARGRCRCPRRAGSACARRRARRRPRSAARDAGGCGPSAPARRRCSAASASASCTVA